MPVPSSMPPAAIITANETLVQVTLSLTPATSWRCTRPVPSRSLAAADSIAEGIGRTEGARFPPLSRSVRSAGPVRAARARGPHARVHHHGAARHHHDRVAVHLADGRMVLRHRRDRTTTSTSASTSFFDAPRNPSRSGNVVEAPNHGPRLLLGKQRDDLNVLDQLHRGAARPAGHDRSE